jgi:hypothetical protein
MSDTFDHESEALMSDYNLYKDMKKQKDILLEAVRSPKTIVKESIQTIDTPKPTFTPPTMDTRKAYADIMNETKLSFTSQDAQTAFRPQVSDPINGNLGAGEVGMDQIMALMNSK